MVMLGTLAYGPTHHPLCKAPACITRGAVRRPKLRLLTALMQILTPCQGFRCRVFAC